MSDDDITGAGPALFQLVRFWARRVPTEPGTAEEAHTNHLQVLDAVDAASRDGREVTVADVAHRLGVDHSGASRLVAAATEAELLAKAASAVDARRAHLRVTEEGLQLLTQSHSWQDESFRQLTQDWPADELAVFARGLRRLAAQAN